MSEFRICAFRTVYVFAFLLKHPFIDASEGVLCSECDQTKAPQHLLIG